MEGKREPEHLLVLKVMRLTKPTLTVTHPVSCDQRDLPGDHFQTMVNRDLASVKGLPCFALGEVLTLPQNFGNIFLGETFSCYISVHNDSQQTCKEILVKADLQTGSQRLTLSGASGQASAQLAPDHSIDDVIHHEVKELGTHILVCSVSYLSQTGEKLYFRKFFKFQVLKPLDVKTKFYNAESDEVYLEAQIENITPVPIYLERVLLEPSSQYTSHPLTGQQKFSSQTVEMGQGDHVFGRADYMNPTDCRQYLYCLTPNPSMYTDSKMLKGVTNIGKLDIVWKTNFGEKGRLQTSALQRVAPGYGDIRLTVEEIPEAVPVEKVFNLSIKVTNCSERTMDLVLHLENNIQHSLQWCGISGKQLGKIQPSGHLVLSLTAIALSPGLQTLSGLRLTDTFLKRTYEHDDITQIYVFNEQE